MAHGKHGTHVQDTFLHQLEQRQRLTEARKFVEALAVQLRHLEQAPESVAMIDNARDLTECVVRSVFDYRNELLERRQAQLDLEFSFGGQS